MKKLALFLVLSFSVNSAFATLLQKDVTCISAGGLELRVPGGGGFYMQPIDIKNDYDAKFLAGLISRHAGQKTTDKEVHLNIAMGKCQLKDDLSLICDDNTFGQASYGYALNGDYVSVGTPISGHVTLKLARDAKGVFQLSLKLVNDHIKGGILVINKEIGPLSDPTQTSLTPWSPGCLISDVQQN